MADYAAQGGESGGGILRIEFTRPQNAINVKDADGNMLLTVTANVISNPRYTAYSTNSQELFNVIGNNNVYFEIQDILVGGAVVNYISPVLPNKGVPILFAFNTDAQSSWSFYPVPQVNIQFNYGMGMLTVRMDLCSAFDSQLSEQTGFPLFNPDIPLAAGDRCIFRGMICEYMGDHCEPIDEYVDGGDTTMSRKLGLNVDYSVFGQLFNMYYNTITGQLGGGGGE